ncbi:MAG TPA: beta-L-arabinofuranosidase domain-containing protein [Anaerolineales bacterium]|jgi:hypothetical protein
MKELSARQVTIRDDCWSPRQELNAVRAIFHQWDELEKSGCIDNFRILAGEKDGFREGWVFADSDAYKWLEAAARINAIRPDPSLKSLMDELVRLISRTQMEDGYINTYNQFHFPGQRWVNLQIEHEMYCLGHLIEAGIAHSESTGEGGALEIALKCANLLVRTFLNGPPAGTDGHEEVEIALLRLFRLTEDQNYLGLARHFIEVRGRINFFPFLYQRELTSSQRRKAIITSQRAEYASSHPEYTLTRIPPDNESKIPPFSRERRQLNALSGQYTQQHALVRRQTVPVGHAVRYAYFQTATTMLSRLGADASLLPALQASWERLVTRRMYVTGGLGSLPGNEGFGFDYELDPEFAYNETCAALASLFWNWEMVLATGDAKFSDLFEWQMYNAASVGMGLDGSTYLYNNPLTVKGGITRRGWYSVPCCPPNLSRTWANLGKYIYSFDEHNLWVHQYIGSQAKAGDSMPASLTIVSGLPYEGNISLRIDSAVERDFSMHLRLPAWCAQAAHGHACHALLNAEPFELPPFSPAVGSLEPTAQGYDPRRARFLSIQRSWKPGDELELNFGLPISLRRCHPKVKNHAGLVAVTRGPLVYCLESIDNPGLDIFSVELEPDSLVAESAETALGKITLLRGKTTGGLPLVFIPYHLWANRGGSQMTVWVKTKSGA